MKKSDSEIKPDCLVYSFGVRYYQLLFLSSTIMLFISCTAKDDFTIGDDFVEAKTKLAIVDTFAVKISTLLADSITTSGAGVVMVGRHYDQDFGITAAVSYFEPGYRSLDLDETYVFDSASIALVYSGYSYGDTTALLSLSIYQLDEEITLGNNNYLYNHSDFAFSDKLLGSKIFTPEPNGGDTLFIPVNSFGERLFQMIVNKDADVSSDEAFLKYLKGFAIKSDYGNSIIGFKADANQVFLEFYYHENGENVTESTASIQFGSVNKQFNTVFTDYSGTDLEKISPDYQELQSEESGNKAFMQAMTGLFPKITFPSLQDITLESRWRILKAELVLEPVVGSYGIFKLPDQICLYRTDEHNKVGNVLSGSDGSVVYSTLVTDEIYNEYTSYTIDISNYIEEELADNYFDSTHGLLLNIALSDLNKSFERLMIKCKGGAVKLRLYYLTY